MTLRIAIVGTGYVGLVSGVCLADLGNYVICVDIDRKKIEKLKKGESVIYEPGLEEILIRNIKRGRLSFTTNLKDAVRNSEIIFIAVGTPQNKDGSADISSVIKVAEDIAKYTEKEKILVIKSTVPVGTSRLIKEKISKVSKHAIHVVSNPEFLREGSAIKDFLEPDRVVIGSSSKECAEKIKSIYDSLDTEIVICDNESAEMIKYASNGFLATKISFINEIANLCDKLGANIDLVAKGMGLDKRIGKEFLKAGCGYGGSCFPKDISALINIGKKNKSEMTILKAVDKVNKKQKLVPIKKLKKYLPRLKDKKIAVWGLAFKPNTDDMREASSIDIINKLLNEGAYVFAYDPIAESNAKHIFKNKKVKFSNSAIECVKGVDALILVTDWDEFKELDLEEVKKLMRGNILIDGRNIYNPDEVKKFGFIYEGIGKR